MKPQKEEVQEKLLKVTIANNKRLKSIDNNLIFFVVITVVAIVFTIMSFFLKNR